MNPITPTLYDGHVTIIANYTPIAFTESHNDGGYAARIIEIYRLYKAKSVFNTFSSMTGYSAPSAKTTAEEINRLVKHGLSILTKEESILQKIKSEIDGLSSRLNNVKSGVTKISDIRAGFEDAKLTRGDITVNLERQKSSFLEQESKINAHKGLLGLLRPYVYFLLDNGEKALDKKILTLLPEGDFPAWVYRGGLLSNTWRSCQYAWDEMDVLVSAVKYIVDIITPPKDKQLLGNGGLARSQYYRRYYSAESELIRSKISAVDYVNLEMQKENTLNSKQYIYSGNL